MTSSLTVKINILMWNNELVGLYKNTIYCPKSSDQNLAVNSLCHVIVKDSRVIIKDKN